MSTQQDAAAPSSAPRARQGRRPSRTVLAAGSVVGALAMGIAGWFAFLSPHDSTVKLTADTSAAVPGKPIPLIGTVTPAAPNRVVEVAVATSPGGPFITVGTAATDSAGRFQTSWSPTQAGKAWVHATALEVGRDQQVQSTAAPVSVRSPAMLALKLSAAAIRTTTAATITATVTPAGGAVTLEKSADGQTWTPLTATASKGGVSTAKLSGLAGGTWHVRGAAAQTDTASAATSKDAVLLVEDYKTAGAKYLAIVAKGNKQVDKLNSLLDAGASLSAVKKQAAVLSGALTQEAKDFRAFKGWPREVAPVIADLAKASVVDADHYHLMSQVVSIDEWNQRADDANASADAGGDAAARARDLLGLPKRNLHP